MVFLVVLEPPRELPQDRFYIWAIVNVISRERFDERLSHPVRLRRAYGHAAWYKSDHLSEQDRLVSASRRFTFVSAEFVRRVHAVD
jgi:hypothetical protein